MSLADELLADMEDGDDDYADSLMPGFNSVENGESAAVGKDEATPMEVEVTDVSDGRLCDAFGLAVQSICDIAKLHNSDKVTASVLVVNYILSGQVAFLERVRNRYFEII